MNAHGNTDYEKRFIHTAGQFEASTQPLSQALKKLNQWQQQLARDLEQSKIDARSLNVTSPLYQQIQKINAAIPNHIAAWAQQWEALTPMQDFANQFDDKLILLVYGKFNAGKSSFCNFFAQRYQHHQLNTQYFAVDAGDIVISDQELKEGLTETTSQLQGVILGDKLVLVDTPGLHSSTQANSDLTQFFTDSADGMLWLSSSASPGQVQELDELAHELNRRKPLLPVLTRSDFIEEDEVNGEIKKVLRNKTSDNRQLQEQDVRQRATEKLQSMGIDLDQLKTPISLSVHTAKNERASPVAMTEAGFEHLYAALLQLIKPAIAYKNRKSVEILRHHLEETVINSLLSELLPQIDDLSIALDDEKKRLLQSETTLNTAVWQQTIPLLPDILNKYESSENVAAVYLEVSHLLQAALSQQITIILADYSLLHQEEELESMTLQPKKEVGYEHIYVDNIEVGISQDSLHQDLEQLIMNELSQRTPILIEQSLHIVDDLLDQLIQIKRLIHNYEKHL